MATPNGHLDCVNLLCRRDQREVFQTQFRIRSYSMSEKAN